MPHRVVTDAAAGSQSVLYARIGAMGQSLSPARTQELSRSVRQEQRRCGDEATLHRRGVELYSVHGLSRPCRAHDATTADQISCNMQQASRNMQQTTCSMYHTTDIMQHVAYNLRHTTDWSANVPRVPPRTCNMPRTLAV